MAEPVHQQVARQVGFADNHPWLAGCGCSGCTWERVKAVMPMCEEAAP